LGEYGYKIANEQGYSPIEQFQLLHSKSQFCVASTRSLLLSTYIKWVNVFPEIKPQLLNIFERYRHVLDAELQQRACEFYALALRPEDDKQELLQTVCEEMPPFPPRASTLLNRLNQKHSDTEDKRIWIHGGKDANAERAIVRRRKPAAHDENDRTAGVKDGEQNIMGALAGLDLSTSNGDEKEIKLPQLTRGPSVDKWFDKLVHHNEGVLYEDVQIQVGIKSRYQGYIGQLAIYVGNKVPTPLTSFTITTHVSDPSALSLTFAKIPPNLISPGTQSQQLLHVECKKMFSTPPVLSISFLAGSHQTVSVRLPVVVTKFLEHVKLNQAEFFERWKLIGGPPREAQSIFPIDLNTSGQLDLARYRQIVSGLQLNVLSDIEPNPNNIVAAGVLHMSEEGKVGCLLRLEPNRDAKVSLANFHFDMF
jgi:AP-2 complex subunit alpha